MNRNSSGRRYDREFKNNAAIFASQSPSSLWGRSAHTAPPCLLTKSLSVN